MFRGIVDGVRFIHRAGIIHSDIKHVNVVVQENTLNPFVIDLGSGIVAGNINTTAAVRESSAMWAPLEVNDENSIV